MEVEGNTAASVQDASFLKKDAVVVVDEKLNNAAVEKSVTGPATATENEIKKSEADCSSTIDLEKVSVENDDLLEQIEEVCNDKASVTVVTDISKTSEHEFLKKIEEMEKKDDEITEVAEEKANNVAEELKAKHIIDCEASTVDDVVVGDKVLEVKEDATAKNNVTPATSSEDAKELPPITTESPKASCTKSKDVAACNKDATVSSSTTPKTNNDLPLAKASIEQEQCKSSISESKVESTETETEITAASGSGNEVEKLDKVEEDKMEVDDSNTVADIEVNEMEVDDAKESDENVEMLSEENSLDNEAKSKPETELNDVDMKETAAKTTERTEEDKPCAENSSSDAAKSINSNKVEIVKDKEEDEHKSEPELAIVVNHTNEDDKIVDSAPEAATIKTKPAENKILLDLKSKSKENVVSSSLTNTPVSSSNVFNSTPIQKQFEISSENVSKISDAAELSHTEKEEEATSTKPISKSFEDSTTESGTCGTSETDHPSSDGTTKKYIDAIKKYNGMPDTTTDEEDTSTPSKKQKPNEKFEIKLSDLSITDFKKDSSYEVNICCEQNDVRYLSIERIDLSSNKNKNQTDKASASESSVQSSSNGSVTSLPTYTLPQTVDTPTSASTSSSTNCNSLIASQNKHTIIGIEELCNFMINQFTKIKHAVNPESAKQAITIASDAITPTHQIKKNKKNSPSAETPSTSTSKSKRARKRSIHEDDVESTPKAKQAKRDISKETPKGEEATDSEDSKSGPCVLAKWVDKKFYAGKITGEKPGSKYVVLFEDGASKTLPRESIVFGEGDTLPLQDQQVYALVDEDYENGVVLSIEKVSNKVYYNVKTENITVKVTASDIYLEVDQAKEIQKLQNVKGVDGVEEEESFGTRPSRNKRPPASPSTPEAGYSGAIGKRGGKRQKRLPFNSAPRKRISEDSDSSDTLESTPPASPKEKAGLELVEGVQPELQNSANDSELARMIFISDYKKIQPNCDIDELLGPLPKSNTLFRNKPFLLTCTVGLRPHRYQQEKAEANENNRFKQFSAVPYVKRYLQKQLEAGGAKIYNYFEDVPKNKYKQCKLIAPRPCITAKYVQCLASDIQTVCHDWVIDSCRQNKLCDVTKYLLPAGWSILAETFVQWKIGKNNYLRVNGQPFARTFVLIAGQHSDFVELWGRVCKAAGAKLRLIKSLDDITPTTNGYMVAESDFSHAIKAKAQHYGIPVVSTVWVVQSIIMGAICPPNNHPSLTQLFEDEEI